MQLCCVESKSACSNRPMPPWATEKLPGEPPVAALAKRPCTVLCVEDDPANLTLMQRLLGRQPELRLLLASEGQHSLMLVSTMRPDVVLMDINLPGLGGLDLMQQSALDSATAPDKTHLHRRIHGSAGRRIDPGAGAARTPIGKTTTP